MQIADNKASVLVRNELRLCRTRYETSDLPPQMEHRNFQSCMKYQDCEYNRIVSRESSRTFSYRINTVLVKRVNFAESQSRNPKVPQT
jgi:hypothetical protein